MSAARAKDQASDAVASAEKILLHVKEYFNE
jgi:hypothetical protein